MLAGDGRVIEGVNVENAAYPLGVCAERTALARAIAEGYWPGDFVAVAITASPCGGCRRQWLHELGVERVVFRNGDRVVTMGANEPCPSPSTLLEPVRADVVRRRSFDTMPFPSVSTSSLRSQWVVGRGAP